jgi:hypothetical protein
MTFKDLRKIVAANSGQQQQQTTLFSSSLCMYSLSLQELAAPTSRHLDPTLHYTYDRTYSSASMYYHLPYARYAPSSCYHTYSIPAYLATSHPPNPFFTTAIISKRRWESSPLVNINIV